MFSQNDQRYWSPPELVKLYRVSADKVRAWIRIGLLDAINVGDGSSRPVFRISDDARLAFESRRAAVATIPNRRSTKRRLPKIEEIVK